MKNYGVNLFVFSSTCAVYGNPIEIPICEDHPKNPINPYGNTKLAVEMMVKDFEQSFGIKYAICRYFNACGADKDLEIGENHNPETHLIPLALKSITDKSTFAINAVDYSTQDGTCVRDFIHVSDLADAHLKALNYLETKKTSNEFNLGTGKGYSIKEILEEIEELTGQKIKTKINPRRAGDCAVLIANSDKAKKLLNFSNLGFEILNLLL